MRLSAARIVLCVAALGASMAARADPPPASPWHWDAVLKIDALHVDPPSTNAGIGYFDLRLTVDADQLFGWRGTVLRIEGLATEGSKPNRRLGTLQGISNLEVVRNAMRLYGAAIEHTWREDASVLLGLYDLNSEFYATEASALLIHPAFGIGAELGQTGANGPSIFPNLGLALRVRAGFGSGAYLQGVVLDAAPGESQDAGRTWVHLSATEGELFVAEAGWRDTSSEAGAPARWAVGVWNYSRAAPRPDESGKGRNAGAYVLGQWPLRSTPVARTTAFVRSGFANPQLHPIEAALDAGVLIENPQGSSGPAAITLGVASAAIGAPYRRALEARGQAASRHETALEAGVRWKVRGLAVQPLAQYVHAPGGRAGRHATVVGVRIEWAPSQP